MLRAAKPDESEPAQSTPNRNCRQPRHLLEGMTMAQDLAPLETEESPTPAPRFARLSRNDRAANDAKPTGAAFPIGALRRRGGGPALIVTVVGVGLCALIIGAAGLSKLRAERFAAFVAGEVAKDAASRNIKVVAVGHPDSYDLSGRSPAQRRSRGYIVEQGGKRTLYHAESVQVCPSHDSTCWRVTGVTYGEDT
jgi:hypothetical protein